MNFKAATHTRYIDPLSDIAFKKIFGSDPNKDLMIAFLNDVLRGKKQIVDLVYSKTEYHGDLTSEGSVSFDLLCTGPGDEKFIIEVQREKHENFKERALFYTSRLISEQAPKGKRREWNYDLTEVFFIAILEKDNSQMSKSKGYLHDICLCNRENGEIFYDKLNYTYIQLSNFDKAEDELASDLDRWLYLLKYLDSMSKIPVYFRKPVFEKLFSIAEYSNLTKEEKMYYDIKLKRKWDEYSARQTMIKDARKEGLEQGREEGLEEGLKEGEEIGALKIAGEMKADGVPVAQIAKYTHLPAEVIEKL